MKHQFIIFILVISIIFPKESNGRWFNISKVIVEDDNRIISNTSKFPFSAVGKVRITKNLNRKFVCTGFLVGPKIVLTNAHCLFDKENQVPAKNIMFYPAFQHGRAVQNGSFSIRKVYASSKFKEGVRGVDFAFLILNKSIGHRFGWFGARSGSNLSKNNLYVAGYGSNFIDAPFKTTLQTVNAHPCSIIREVKKGKALLHDCDTGQGSSGSPLFYKENGKAFVLGVNYGGWGPRDEERMNGCSITPENDCGNTATKSEEFIQLLVELRKKYK